MNRPRDAVTVLCLLGTSLVIARLGSRIRAEAHAARVQRDNLDNLYRVAKVLLAIEAVDDFELRLLEAILTVFHLRAVCLLDAATMECRCAGEPSPNLIGRTRETYVSGAGSHAGPESLQCLRAGNRTIGAIGFEGLEHADIAAGPLAALVAAAMDRTRALRVATQATVQAETETTRGAILDALAHEFKTPLATILTAAGGLDALGSLRPEQTELVEMIESEASRIGGLTSRLLRLARLDEEGLKPKMELTDMGVLAADIVERFTKMWPRRRFCFGGTGRASTICGDPELLVLAISQLLDNACRYSPTGTVVQINVETRGRLVTTTVWNEGPPIPVHERDRIFERFYRGQDARRASGGSGLGLYVARRIAAAHSATLDLVTPGEDPSGVAFRLQMPVSESR